MSFVHSAVADGLLDPRGKTRHQFVREIRAYLKPVAHGKARLQFVTDHRVGLLRQARFHRTAGKNEEAVLYYATWVEHMLNIFAASALRRQRCPPDVIRQFIRDTGVTGKYIFIIHHFCGRAPSRLRLAQLGDLAQRRNQFVHYKWLYMEEADWEKQDADYAHSAKDAERLVTHFASLEAKYLRRGLQKRLKKA